ncbi:hypothetical protein ACF09C_13235 [Streptomyces sp. NPDC014870]|uniref:hypothetical protein n=1 Tax=Streptomyces sp. NPDC014870 TaxID=3364925 RepID=UPI0036F5F255
MSAHEIPAGSLSAAFVVTGSLAWCAGGRRRGAAAIAGGLAAVQTALHLIFSAGQSHGGGTAGHTAMDHATAQADPATAHAAMDPATAHTAVDQAMTSVMETTVGSATEMTVGSVMETVVAAAGSQSSLGMLAAHLLAALFCGLWLARGEAALFALARTVAALAFTPLRLLLAVVRVPEPPRSVRPRPRTPRRARGVVLAHSLSRRGPPRLPVPRATALGAHV